VTAVRVHGTTADKEFAPQSASEIPMKFFDIGYNCLIAAQGWLELDGGQSANDELKTFPQIFEPMPKFSKSAGRLIRRQGRQSSKFGGTKGSTKSL
jgi:hypothetical protein